MKEIIVLLAALLHLHPFPAVEARCVEAHRLEIAAQVHALERDRGVPGGLLLAVGFFESHNGCDPRSGGNWGAVRPRRPLLASAGPRAGMRRTPPGTAADAARALAAGFTVCGTWQGAASRFRCGLCVCPADHERPMRPGELACPAPGVRALGPAGPTCQFAYVHNQGYGAADALGLARKLYAAGGAFTPVPAALAP